LLESFELDVISIAILKSSISEGLNEKIKQYNSNPNRSKICAESDRSLGLMQIANKRIQDLLRKEFAIEELAKCAQIEGPNDKTCNMTWMVVIALADQNRALMYNLKMVRIAKYLNDFSKRLSTVHDGLIRKDKAIKMAALYNASDLTNHIKKLKSLFQKPKEKPKTNKYFDYDKWTQYSKHDSNIIDEWERLGLFLSQRFDNPELFRVDEFIKDLQSLVIELEFIQNFFRETPRDKHVEIFKANSINLIMKNINNLQGILKVILYGCRDNYETSILSSSEYIFNQLNNSDVDNICKDLLETMLKSPHNLHGNLKMWADR